MAMVIRPIAPEDAEVIVRMSDALTPHEGLPSGGFTVEAYVRDGFGPERAFDGLICEADGTVAGYLLYQPLYDSILTRRGYFVLDLYVAPAHRNQGGGRQLMQSLGRIARSRGAQWIAWGVMPHDKGAIRFYERLGAEYDDHISMLVDVDKLV
jgi:GNAT superfamily N-acetyltransferase